MTTKTVQWSYPTSGNAKRFGFYHTGCWTLETITGSYPPKPLSGFQNREDALSAARKMPEPWNWMFVKFNPADAT